MRRLTASCTGGGRFGSGLREVRFLEESVEAGVGAEGVEEMTWVQEYHLAVALLLLQPGTRSIVVAEPDTHPTMV